MNYKRIIDRVFINLHVEDEDSKSLRIVRNDIEDVLVDVFGRSEYPKKEITFNIKETEDIIEDFADTILIDNLSLSNVTIFAGKGNIAADTSAVLLLSGLSKINTFQFTIAGTFAATNVVGTVEILNYDDTVAWSESFSLSALPQTPEFIPAVSGANLRLRITVSAPADIADLTIDSFSYNVDDNSILLPDDFFLPMEVMFNSGNKRYVSKEMTPEQYMLWTPHRYNLDAGTPVEVTALDESLDTYSYTAENIDYDYKIGYYFRTAEDGVYLHWKPNFAGTITMYYSYLPIITIADASKIQVHRVYVDLLVNGATMKAMLRKFTKANSNLNDVLFASMRLAYTEYKNEYNRLLAVFTGWVDQRATPAMILPFSILSDTDMELE